MTARTRPGGGSLRGEGLSPSPAPATGLQHASGRLGLGERRPPCSPRVWAGTTKLCTCYPTDTGFSGDQPPGQSMRTPSGPHR